VSAEAVAAGAGTLGIVVSEEADAAPWGVTGALLD
jgi:hypothetical protein